MIYIIPLKKHLFPSVFLGFWGHHRARLLQLHLSLGTQPAVLGDLQGGQQEILAEDLVRDGVCVKWVYKPTILGWFTEPIYDIYGAFEGWFTSLLLTLMYRGFGALGGVLARVFLVFLLL